MSPTLMAAALAASATVASTEGRRIGKEGRRGEDENDSVVVRVLGGVVDPVYRFTCFGVVGVVRLGRDRTHHLPLNVRIFGYVNF